MGLEKALFYSISQGDIQQVARVLSSSTLNINVQNHLKQTAIFLAASHRNPCISKMLMAFGADPSIKDKHGSTAISIATFNKDLDILSVLHSKMEDIKYPDQKMNVKEMFLYAVHLQQIKRVILMLVDTSTLDINAQNGYGQTTVHLAVCNNDLYMLEILTAFGANLNKQDNQGYTALSLAILNDNLNMARALLALGAKHNIHNIRDNFPIHIAAERKILPIIKELFSKQTINMKNDSGFTPLHLAIKCGNAGAVKELLKYCEIDVNAQDNNGNTPWIMAVKENYPEIARILLKYGVDINLKGYAGHISEEIKYLITIRKSSQLKRKSSMNRSNHESPVPKHRKLIDELDENSHRSHLKSLEDTCEKFLDRQSISSFPRKIAMRKRKNLTDISSRCESSSNMLDINLPGPSYREKNVPDTDSSKSTNTLNMSSPRSTFSRSSHSNTSFDIIGTSSNGSSFRSDSLSMLNISSSGSNTSRPSSSTFRCTEYFNTLDLGSSEHSSPEPFTKQSTKKARLR